MLTFEDFDISLIVSFTLALLFIIFFIFYVKIRNKRWFNRNRAFFTQIRKRENLHLAEIRLRSSEWERKQIAREIHDGVLGELAMLKLNLSRKLSTLKISAKASKHLFEEVENLNIAIGNIRSICHSMHGDKLNKTGLLLLIEQYLNSIRESVKIQVTFSSEISDSDYHIGRSQKNNCYRIIQEIVNNIIKHSYAGSIRVEINSLHSMFCIKIQHDGNTFTNAQADHIRHSSPTLGLKSLFERTEAINGSIDYLVTEEGNIILIKIPVSYVQNNTNSFGG